MKKILITGVNGYIGRKVVQAFVDSGWTTDKLLLVDMGPESLVPGGTYMQMNVLDYAADTDLYSRLGEPEYVLHLAWQDGFNHNAASHLHNLESHFLFLRNMVDAGCSSISVMGTMHEVGYWEGAITENTPCNPQSMYGIAKNALRQATLAYCTDKAVSVKWLRAYYITGDDASSRSIFSKILDWEAEGKETFAFTTGRNLYDFIDVNTLAHQIMLASVQNTVEGIINVCSGQPTSLKDKVEQFIAEKGLRIRPEYGAFPDRPYDSPGVWGDAGKINLIMTQTK